MRVSGPHGSDEFLQVGDNRDIFFPTSPHTILPERVVSWDPRINYDHVFTCLPGAFQARLKARVGLFLDFESKWDAEINHAASLNSLMT